MYIVLMKRQIIKLPYDISSITMGKRIVLKIY